MTDTKEITREQLKELLEEVENCGYYYTEDPDDVVAYFFGDKERPTYEQSQIERSVYAPPLPITHFVSLCDEQGRVIGRLDAREGGDYVTTCPDSYMEETEIAFVQIARVGSDEPPTVIKFPALLKAGDTISFKVK